MTERQRIARENQLVADGHKQNRAKRFARILADNLPGAELTTASNAPFDILIGKEHFIEVKVLFDGVQDRIYMDVSTKNAFLKSDGNSRTKIHVIVYDQRNGKRYHSNQLGNLYLTSMTPWKTVSELKKLMGI